MIVSDFDNVCYFYVWPGGCVEAEDARHQGGGGEGEGANTGHDQEYPGLCLSIIVTFCLRFC